MHSSNDKLGVNIAVAGHKKLPCAFTFHVHFSVKIDCLFDWQNKLKGYTSVELNLFHRELNETDSNGIPD